MAKAKAAASDVIKVRVLIDCPLGKCDEVVELGAAELDNALSIGWVDSNPEAVAYAESLKG